MTADRKYYRVNEWCLLNAISRRSFYREVAAGRIVVRKYGTRTLVPAGQSLPTSLPTIRRVIGIQTDAQPGTNEVAKPLKQRRIRRNEARDGTQD